MDLNLRLRQEQRNRISVEVMLHNLESWMIEAGDEPSVTGYYIPPISSCIHKNFYGCPKLLFGQLAWKARKPDFTLCEPDEATEIMLIVEWGWHKDPSKWQRQKNYCWHYDLRFGARFSYLSALFYRRDSRLEESPVRFGAGLGRITGAKEVDIFILDMQYAVHKLTTREQSEYYAAEFRRVAKAWMKQERFSANIAKTGMEYDVSRDIVADLSLQREYESGYHLESATQWCQKIVIDREGNRREPIVLPHVIDLGEDARFSQEEVWERHADDLVISYQAKVGTKPSFQLDKVPEMVTPKQYRCLLCLEKELKNVEPGLWLCDEPWSLQLIKLDAERNAACYTWTLGVLCELAKNC